MIRIIATITDDNLGLEEECEVIGVSQKTMEILVDLRMAKIYDDTKPIVGKSVNKHETKSYPINRQVFYNDSIYISNTTTATTFISSEWDILVTGAKKRKHRQWTIKKKYT